MTKKMPTPIVIGFPGSPPLFSFLTQISIYPLYHKPARSDYPPGFDIAGVSLRFLSLLPFSETKGLHTLCSPQPHSQLQRGAVLLIADGVNPITVATSGTNNYKNRQACEQGRGVSCHCQCPLDGDCLPSLYLSIAWSLGFPRLFPIKPSSLPLPLQPVPTPAQQAQLQEIVSKVGIEDLDDQQVEVEGLQTHPGEDTEQEVVENGSSDPAGG